MKNNTLSNMWKFTFQDPQHERSVQQILQDYTKQLHSVEKHQSNPGYQRRLRYVKQLEDLEMETRFDFYGTFIDYQHRLILRKLLIFSKERGHDPANVMRTFFIVLDARFYKKDNRIVDEDYLVSWMAHYSRSPLVLANVFRENINTIKTLSEDLSKRFALQYVDEILDFLLNEFSDLDLLAMGSGHLDEELIDLIVNGRELEPACSDQVLEKYAVAAEKAKALYETLHRQLDGHYFKNVQTFDRLIGDIEVDDSEEDFRSEHTLVTTLVAFWKIDIRKEMRWYMQGASRFIPSRGQYSFMAFDPIFWHIALQLILKQFGMISGNDMDEAAFQMVVDVIHRPKKFHKNKYPARLAKLKSKLKATLAPYVSKPRRTEATEAAQMLKTEAPSQRLSILASELAELHWERVREEVALTGLQENAIDEFFHILQTWSNQDLLDALYLTYLGDGASGHKCAEVGGTESGNDIPEIIEEPEWEADGELEIPAHDNYEEAVTCRYVKNPDKGLAKYEEVEFRDEDDMQRFLHRNKIGITIKPSSTLKAIRHFGSIPDDIKHTAIKEDIHGQRWQKLKRDSARILLHEEDGHTYVHIYQRKDWKYRTY